ncbi:acyl-CoA dehydrogenase [Mycobacterium sp. MFM001]|uniref:acyl-CoA dehydrogenase family protein n=1 Tax=Mycobacterium sp. MFM001 TaxID=2049453 RepID=UPI000DA486F0|nr:acyl-CoA dehydrogenase family protein [Mycobacterium sp. MFM001]GBE64482.1 acyl-CoA dehydrogenase [Mycobacterium sp. MFM001]
MTAADHDDLRDAVRSFLQARSSSAAVRHVMETPTGYDERVWRQLAGEMGLVGIAVPEEFGGADAGMRELAVVLEEMGAALLCSPFFATVVLAAHALLTSGDRDAMVKLLPRLVDGSTTATLILNDGLGTWDPDSVTLVARKGPEGFLVSGPAPMVLDGHTADVLLLAARTEAGLSLFAVESTATGLQREPLASLDRTRRIAALGFDDVPADLIGADGAAATGLARTSDLALVALAAEQVGAAQRCLDMAVGYAKTRIQFGRPIGSFQAVKHRCADMLVAVEGARSAAMHAAEAADAPDNAELPIAASVAKMACSDAFLQAALGNMHVHGGIGFTWEHDAHLYVRRAKASQLMFGSPDMHAQRLADLTTT